MLRRFLIASALGFVALADAPSRASELGTAFCFGIQCPCGNDSATTGCINSSGNGGYLTAVGSTSVAAADIEYRATGLATHSVSLLVLSQSTRNIPFRDGRLCVGPGMHRMRTHANSGQDGAVAFTDVIETYADYGLLIQAGETWHAQVWYRDSSHGGMCGGKANVTSGYTVTFTP
jgi:hypothetical protein